LAFHLERVQGKHATANDAQHRANDANAGDEPNDASVIGHDGNGEGEEDRQQQCPGATGGSARYTESPPDFVEAEWPSGDANLSNGDNAEEEHDQIPRNAKAANEIG
jgi:hypothetical protein